MKKILGIIILLFMLGVVIAQETKDPRVERVTTKERARQVKVRFDGNIFVMYDLPYAGLASIWKANNSIGGNFVKPESYGNHDWDYYGTNHHKGSRLSQFDIVGSKFFEQNKMDQYYPSRATNAQITNYYSAIDSKTKKKWSNYPTNYRPWTITQGGSNKNAKVKPKGYLTKKNGNENFVLKFNLVWGTHEVLLTETPKISNGGKTIERTITVNNLPAGFEVRNHLDGGNWSVTGGGSKEGDNLVINANGTAVAKGTF